jgi:hypothetical protein
VGLGVPAGVPRLELSPRRLSSTRNISITRPTPPGYRQENGARNGGDSAFIPRIVAGSEDGIEMEFARVDKASRVFAIRSFRFAGLAVAEPGFFPNYGRALARLA